MRYIIFVLSLFGSFASPLAMASFGNSGGGGKGVVCLNPDSSIKSVTLLDLWEGQTLYHETPLPSSGSIESDVDSALQRLQDSFKNEGDIYQDGKQVCVNQACALFKLRESAKLFLTNDKSVLRLHGDTLTPTDDALESVQPAGCKIEQIVNYQPGGQQILVNQDLVDKMDPLNQAALIVHESYYQLLRQTFNETNSLRVRRAVAYVVSGSSFTLPLSIPKEPGQWLCKGKNSDASSFVPYEDYLIFEPDFSKVQLETVGGTELIGISADMYVITSPLWVKNMFADCQGTDSGQNGTFGWDEMDGPVEFDRTLHLISRCDTGKRQISLAVRAPGSKKFTTSVLDCEIQK